MIQIQKNFFVDFGDQLCKVKDVEFSIPTQNGREKDVLQSFTVDMKNLFPDLVQSDNGNVKLLISKDLSSLSQI